MYYVLYIYYIYKHKNEGSYIFFKKDKEAKKIRSS